MVLSLGRPCLERCAVSDASTDDVHQADLRALTHSHISTPLLFASQTAHWELTGQYMLVSQMRVASLTRPGMASCAYGV